jgi:hypothetical protein
VFDQAAAVLVALTACLAPNFHAIALPALLDEWLAIAGPPHTGFLSLAIALVGREILRVIVDGAPLEAALGVPEMFPQRHGRWW